MHRGRTRRRRCRFEPIDHRTALQFVVDWLARRITGVTVIGAGHRGVPGGTRCASPVLIDVAVLALE
jgi:acetate kinase